MVSEASATPFRADIQALRAIAVVSVVLFHLWPNSVPGGYIGVDVFFVISGFLISTQLVREAEKKGRIDLSEFWIRRIKRLQPAALLTLIATTIGILVWVPRTFHIQFLQEVIASALQLENWLLGFNSVDYLASENNASPTQHFWTLSVEEQFYVGFPLLIFAALHLAKRFSISSRKSIATIIAIAAVASFAFSLWQTAAAPSMAYFSTLTRAWEFALGALLSLLTIKANRAVTWTAPIAGVLLIIGGCFLYNGETRFPGYAAILPVAGAMLCLWAGAGSILEAAGRIPFIFALGRYSYAIYLWHWPLIILAPYALGQEIDLPWRIVIAVLTFVLAKLSTEWVEDPIRFSPRLLGGNRRKRIVATCSLVSLALLLTAAYLPIRAEQARRASLMAEQEKLLASHEQPPAAPASAGGEEAPFPVDAGSRDGEPAPVTDGDGGATSNVATAEPASSPRPITAAQEQPGPPAVEVPAVNGMPACFGAQKMDPKYANCRNDKLGDQIFPDVSLARADDANRTKCWGLDQDGGAKICAVGPTSGYTKRVYAIGDSHNNTLIGVYEYIAKKNNWRIDVSGHSGCYLTTSRQKASNEDSYNMCLKWRESAIAHAHASPYDAFLVTHSMSNAEVVPEEGKSTSQATIDGLVAAWRMLPERPILAIRDNPGMRQDTIDCVLREGANASKNCAVARSTALPSDGQVEAALQVENARVIDMSDFYCSKSECPPVIGNVLVYRDRTHITSTFAKTLAPYMEQEVVKHLDP
jgi:peptidoglycan/LPS O-acetylase OafA/YrhL